MAHLDTMHIDFLAFEHQRAHMNATQLKSNNYGDHLLRNKGLIYLLPHIKLMIIIVAIVNTS